MAAHSSRLVTTVTWNAVECMNAWALDEKVPHMGHQPFLALSIYSHFGGSSHLLLLKE